MENKEMKDLSEWFANEEGMPQPTAYILLLGLVKDLPDKTHHGDCVGQSEPCTLCLLENILKDYYAYTQKQNSLKTVNK